MITIGSSSTLSLSIPTNSERNWGTAIRTGCFQKIVDHDHNGTAGTGKKLSGYLALDLTTSILTNNAWLSARNSTNSGNLNLLKINTSNQLVLGETAQVSLLYGIKEINAYSTALALLDNQAVAVDTGMIAALSATNTIIVDYKIIRNSVSQVGTLVCDKDTGSVSNEYVGTSTGVTFSMASGIIKYISTSTGFAPSIYFTIRRL